MNRPLWLAVVLFTASLYLVIEEPNPLVAQQPQNLYPQPRIQTVFPLGAKAGTDVDVSVVGTDLDEPTELVFSHPGIKGTYIEPPEPPTKDPKKAPPPPTKGRRKGAPAPTEAKFKVTVAANVPSGNYDVRSVGKYGVSNPRYFSVSKKTEVSEKEPNDDVDKAQRIEIGTIISGVINNPTDVDYYVFKGKKGQRVLMHAMASSIDSKCHPWIEVYSKEGRQRLTENRNYDDTDALADLTLPEDGDYYIRTTEFAHTAGNADHFYRLSVTTDPWVDAVFPIAIEPGKTAPVTLYGRNLPGGKPVVGMTVRGKPIESLVVNATAPKQVAGLTSHHRITPPMALLDAFDFTPPGIDQSILLYESTGKVVLEKEGNDKPETAQVIPVPCEVAGRVDRRADQDWYNFTAKKGEIYVIELFADRLGNGLDLAMTVRNAATKADIANENNLDDDAESLHPTSFYSRNTDPVPYRFTVPADGQYLVRVAPQSSIESGPRFNYRLRITPPKPDFRAIAMARSRELPAAEIARPDGTVAYDVFAYRVDGFTGPLTVTAVGLPTGVTATPSTIGTGQKWGTLVLTGGAGLKDTLATFKIVVTGTIDGKSVASEARPATITWGLPAQPNVPLVTRLDQTLVLATREEKPPFRLQTDLAAATIKLDGKDQKISAPFVLKPGDKLTFPVKVIWHEKEARAQPMQLQAEATQQNMQQAPVTINNGQPVALPKEKSDMPVTVEVKANAAPGLYGVAIRGDTQVKFARDPMGKDKKDITATSFAPPVEVKVIPASVAKVTVASPGNLKQGATAEVTVKVERQAEYTGEYSITITLPKEAMGVTVDKAKIAAGANEAKVKVTASKDAKVGAINNIPVNLLAMYEGKYEMKQEAKFNLNITK